MWLISQTKISGQITKEPGRIALLDAGPITCENSLVRLRSDRFTRRRRSVRVYIRTIDEVPVLPVGRAGPGKSQVNPCEDLSSYTLINLNNL